MQSRHAVVFALGIGLIGCAPDGTSDAGTTIYIQPDAAYRRVDAGPFDCFGLINCANACGSQQCVQTCSADSTAMAQTLDTTLEDCLSAACPATDGGPCELNLSGACQDCIQNAQLAGQPCAADIMACIDDMGGSAGDLTGSGCNSLINCLNGCASLLCESNCLYAASSLGNQLYEIFVECLNQSCPDVDGGPCANGSSQSCSNCEGAVLGTGGTCDTAYSNCVGSP
jgi:hypothetical protein